MESFKNSEFLALKKRKLSRIESLLDGKFKRESLHFNFLSNEVVTEKSDNETKVSSHDYDRVAREMISNYTEGLILDCGAGYRNKYYENIINFEVEPYPTTDVVGLADNLPFKDNSLDAVLCLNVLEHVRNPFKVAREIIRVLKQDGELYCVVPFLQPYHAYPDHFYNMSSSGLKNLFCDGMEINKSFVYKSGHPIHSLSWILNSWSNSLADKTRKKFLNMKVMDLMKDPYEQLSNDYVEELDYKKVEELASTTSILAHKK
ncbi:class I SAM-dependent methyltransferase [Opitutales bacterium]|nr:class I SAM-dependent methyltransferase [Opitutales bacterium]